MSRAPCAVAMLQPRTVELKRAKQGAKRAAERALSLSGVPQSGQSSTCRESVDLLLEEVTLEGAEELFGLRRVNPRCSMRWWFLLRVMTSVTVSS